MRDRRLNFIAPGALARRLDACEKIRWGMKKRILTVLLHDFLNAVEGDESECWEHLFNVLRREHEILHQILEGDNYKEFRK